VLTFKTCDFDHEVMTKVIEGKQKNQEKFLVKTMLRDEMFFFKCNKKRDPKQTKNIAIKIMRPKFDIKIN
jgi:hypothetical protein